MSPTLAAFLRSWPWEPWLSGALLLTAAIYFRGWLTLRKRDSRQWDTTQLAAFGCGLAAIFLALASPIDPFASLLLAVHMVQHLLLMMVAPPLLLRGSPFLPLLRGLPRTVRLYWIRPLLRVRPLARLVRWLAHPLRAFPIFVLCVWLWHIPRVYEAALRSDGWHYLQHVCFFGAGVLFWFPVVRPYPSHPHWSTWLLLPYLLLADVQNTVLSALFTFSHQVIYKHYDQVPRLAGISALGDQAAAGVIMWVPGSVAFLVPLFVIAIRLLWSGNAADRVRTTALRPATPRASLGPLPILHPSPLTTTRLDLTRVPLLGGFLNWRHARTALQIPLFLLAALIIFDGFRGPQLGPMNLAGVLPWIHWRGFLMLGVLAIGNVFCLACPFTLPRTLARRWRPASRRWPRPLRSKWLAVIILALYFWAYEAFALWDSPWLTAWIVVAYFAVALAIDGFFEGAAFCKYVCPIGQFNFVQSLISPFEVRIRAHDVCAGCHTKDCIRGRAGIQGCELNLFLPQKADNFDCTLCLDCVHACPHDNIGLVLTDAPLASLWRSSAHRGSSILTRRLDVAALVLVIVFGAFANAAGMVGPILNWEDVLTAKLGAHSRLPIVGAFYFLALVLLPLALVACAAMLSRHWGRLVADPTVVATQFSLALVPLGFAMWLAHYSFHLFTSCAVIVPAAQRVAMDFGFSRLGVPRRLTSCCRPIAEWLPRAEILCLDVGLLLSLYVGYRIALSQCRRPARALSALLPWAALMSLLFAVGIWIVLQPMQMRGTLPNGG